MTRERSTLSDFQHLQHQAGVFDRGNGELPDHDYVVSQFGCFKRSLRQLATAVDDDVVKLSSQNVDDGTNVLGAN